MRKKVVSGCAPSRREVSCSKIKVCENGRSAVILNSGRARFFVTKVDGGLVRNEPAADFVISKVNAGDLVVELKGADVDRACQQIESTILTLRSCVAQRGPMAGLIVCSRVPAIDTKVQRLKAKFRREFSSKLVVRSSNAEFAFESFF